MLFVVYYCFIITVACCVRCINSYLWNDNIGDIIDEDQKHGRTKNINVGDTGVDMKWSKSVDLQGCSSCWQVYILLSNNFAYLFFTALSENRYSLLPVNTIKTYIVKHSPDITLLVTILWGRYVYYIKLLYTSVFSEILRMISK